MVKRYTDDMIPDAQRVEKGAFAAVRVDLIQPKQNSNQRFPKM